MLRRAQKACDKFALAMNHICCFDAPLAGYWKQRIIVMPLYSSLLAMQIAMMTIFGAKFVITTTPYANIDDEVGIMKTSVIYNQG